MAYRNGTYIAFHAEGTSQPTDSDMKYYNLMKAWTGKDDGEFYFVNSHDKTAAVRDSSSRATLERALRERLNNSRNMVLIIGETTALDTDWVPFEIRYAVDNCEIPIIAAYTDYEYVLKPTDLSSLWPAALEKRINDQTARVIHIPFKKLPLADAIESFDHDNLPQSPLTIYTLHTYRTWGIAK